MKFSQLSVLTLVALVGCTSAVQETSISQENLNPLTAAFYGDELANTLADLIIQDDPIVETIGKDAIQEKIADAKTISRIGKEEINRGRIGNLLEANEFAFGAALYLDDRLYFSPSFETEPGVDLHVYLSQAVDPLEWETPDETAIDLGEIQRVRGAHTYVVPSQEDPDAIRLLVLWDNQLNRLYGWTQLSRREN